MTPTPVPDADVAVDPALVRALLRAQHPDLAQLELRFADDGWDNVIYRLGDELAVRLPRREVAHALLLNEVRWLPFLAPRLPLPVPVPLYRGRPGEGYPYHWAVVPWFAGSSAASVGARVRDGYAGELAAFFRALHVPAPADAPRNLVRGVPLRDRDQALRERLEAVPEPERAALRAIWERGLAEVLHAGPRLWLHGDPHPHNMLVRDADGGDAAGTARPRLGAVIDFGDLTAGDPASDLAVAWLHFSESGREVFRTRLEGDKLYSPGTWARARAWAVNYAVLMAGLPTGDPLHGVGVHGIGQLLAEA
ncbi:aminoglycoside phosphotransferase family protein [Paeniglutamicibacter psychrophenolicus]|uniref:Aminoglycoside phosphotransferase (APT) family kinase protein n=1 Tax=Paeniglutamicibacter psychrophenolicus TaxID=257454 RepID=A0ABS4WI29_9MICC|nr:aminoglycoside phosphotransferase family protein [Paeniglutamicibacter psychrophenolicus]MBP2375856.1 aminoglycoside phosphotransferase (APT) family kinase protein [Paeniglutamicibacter psychrophenolicus]